LGRVEPFARDRIAEALTERGVRIRFGTEPVRVARPQVDESGEGRVHGGPVTVTVRDGNGETDLEADEIVVAAGRTPATEDLGLESVGLKPGYVEVDDHLTVPGLPWL
ncbi:FAD-dependent oxidoreductase, partial [Nocardia farcinica]